VRRRAAPLIVAGSVALLLVAPRAPGLPDVPGDPTPPVVTPVITGTLGSAGWYVTNVTVNWAVSDPESIILSTTGCNATTLTANTSGTQLSCTAESDGGTTTIGKTFKVDKTPPAANASPSRNADVNGWYNKPLSVSFAATDGMSGVDSCSGSVDYAGPDTTGTPVAGTCRDVAGNTSSASETVKYDATSPSASASARAADSNGWFNHAVTVTFVGADGTSGVGTCTQQTYAGPDDSSVALTGTCTDNAGNVSPSRSFTLKYDETAPTASATPSRAADVNGWHNHALTVSFSGDDATSGLESCDAPKSYSGPDSATAAVGGACRDWAGNVAPRSFAFKYDGTAPTVTATPARAANANGWYSAPIGVTFTGTDPVASVATCSASKTYSGPDNASAEVTGSCTDAAGNVGNKALPVKYDATAPQATATPARAAGPTGWYVAPLAVGFTATDPTSGVDTCDVDKTYSGPDSASATVGGACRDKAGNSGSASLPLKYDATKPAVTASASRPAGTNGWYSAPLTVGFTGSDATSGVDTCDADKTYAGPDAVSTAVTGSCRDKAGNSQNGQLALKYDATAPQVTASASRVADANGWYNHALSVSFGGTDPTAGIDTCDAAKSYSGPDGAAASVTGSCRDKAGNTASAPLGLKYDATAPALTGITPSRPPDADQWYNRALSVQFQGADGMSGVESCTQVNYGGPDNVAASVSGSCGDKAGNRTASSAFAFKYDATAPAVTATPERVADANGWYNHALSVSFAGADATSDIRNCDAAKTYSGPDAASTSVPGSCRDNAGNVGTGSAAVKYDATNPTASATPSRAANANGWYGAPLTVSFTGADALSGLDFCDAAKSYSGPDRATATVGGACKDKAGNTQTASFGLNYDATAPQVTASASRAADANGWYNHGLSVAFAGTDVTAGVDSCDAAKPYSGPDTVAVTLTGSCRDKAGNAASAPLTLKYDATKPTAAPTASRAPDANGWFNHPVAVTYAGSDATSGVDTCTQQTYAGPDNAAVSIDGTCKDKAGNLSASGSFGLKYDATAPATTASPSRAAGSNGWYNAPLSVSFSGPDVTSGLDSCDAAKSYAGPDSASASVGGACRDKAGNSASATLPLKYDATAPGVTATPARPPGTNGWYRAPVGVTFTGADAMSGPDTCDAAKAYSGPDSASTAVAGNCRDKAGNSGTGSFGLKYDATAPQVTASTSRVADSNGWFNHPLSVSFTATDDTAGVDTCDAAKPYGGPDSTGAPVSGTCTDKAGNTRTVARTVKYDATAPVADAVPAREPDANGWYNHAVAVGFGGSDSTSGIAACSNAQTYEGPDTPSVSLSGSCSDQAGNPSAPDSIAIQYDATAPQILDSGAVRPPDRAGWYNRPIAFAIVASDVTSGIASCPNVTYAGPDDGSASFAASCADRAGNRGIRQMPLRYDATAPATAARPDRAPDSNGWYNHAFAVSFAGEDGISGLESCSPPESYAGPDSEVVEVGGVCTDRAGNVGLASVTAGYDATAPAVTAHADRPPDANGWYSRPLVVAFQGADATSQIEGCTQASYGGPDASAGSVSGSCRDRAGNSNASSFGLRYDSTAPALGQVGAKAGNATATLTWAASPDIAVVRVRRGETVVYTGAGTTFTDKGLDNGVLYRYTVTAYDEAENAASSSVTVRPSGPLLQPAANAVVSGPPRLAWKPVPKATYYNVQLWRRGRILSLWPARASLQLPRRWKYNGRRYRLTDGRYRWYVFPGYGRRSEHRFGKRLGSSSFIVR
jgi:hypothetical protein